MPIRERGPADRVTLGDIVPSGFGRVTVERARDMGWQPATVYLDGMEVDDVRDLDDGEGWVDIFVRDARGTILVSGDGDPWIRRRHGVVQFVPNGGVMRNASEREEWEHWACRQALAIAEELVPGWSRAVKMTFAPSHWVEYWPTRYKKDSEPLEVQAPARWFTTTYGPNVHAAIREQVELALWPRPEPGEPTTGRSYGRRIRVD